MLALLLGLIALGLAPQSAPQTGPPATAARDADLYRAITGRVGRGESYYSAAPAEHRRLGYPLKPFVTVRPPLLAEATASIGATAAGLALRLTVLFTLIAFALRLRQEPVPVPARMAAIALAAASLVVFAQPDLAVWHEIWAGLLVTLALALRTPRHWLASAVIGSIAATLRELAIPFVLVMAFAAIVERRRAEAIGWGIALIVSALLLADHAREVAMVVLDTDRVSPGWVGGGWSTVLSMLGKASIFTLAPDWVVAVLVPLALLGWAGLRSQLGLRAALWTGGMAAAFALVGRPDNIYWGAMIAPVLPVGLAFAPAAVRDLVKAARGGQG